MTNKTKLTARQIERNKLMQQMDGDGFFKTIGGGLVDLGAVAVAAGSWSVQESGYYGTEAGKYVRAELQMAKAAVDQSKQKRAEAHAGPRITSLDAGEQPVAAPLAVSGGAVVVDDRMAALEQKFDALMSRLGG